MNLMAEHSGVAGVPQIQICTYPEAGSSDSLGPAA
jgi:hypothetical protein